MLAAVNELEHEVQISEMGAEFPEVGEETKGELLLFIERLVEVEDVREEFDGKEEEEETDSLHEQLLFFVVLKNLLNF